MRGIERVMRLAAIALLIVALWRVLTWDAPGARPMRIETALRAALPAIPMGRVPAVHLSLDHAPDVVERDWLAAIRRSGTVVTWNDAGIADPAALAMTSLADPAGGVAIDVATRSTGIAIVTDTLGVIDSVALGTLGGRIVAPSVQGPVTVRTGDAIAARASPPPPRALRPVVVLASAGWESKFVIAALEERGWIVHSRVRVSPTAVVTQGRQLRLDTANHSAVLVLDSAAVADAPALIAYVRTGGGLVLAGDAARSPALAGIVPGRPGNLLAGSLLRSASASGREGLPVYPVVNLRPDAVAIDERDGRVVAAARRERAGRVVVVGEVESWRWRMAGGDDAPADHRAWWSRIVSSAAYAPASSISPVDPEAAPFAALVDAIGPPGAVGPDAPPPASPPLPPLLGAVILGLLVAEWASRRLRGSR